MTTQHAFENLLRSPLELMVAVIAFSFGLICITNNHAIALTQHAATIISIPFFILAAIRAKQGFKVLFYRKRLLTLKPFAMSTVEVPCSKENLYMGRGFRWLAIHRQRLQLLTQTQYSHYLQKSRLYRWIQKRADDHPKKICDKIRHLPLLPFKPMPDIGGKSWLHGVGSDAEQQVFIKQHNRNSHMVIFGRTRVGKTRCMSILVNQDIQNGEAVLVIDPKGDLEILQDMYCACREAGRLDDFKILHAGMPDISAKYNPLKQYTNISEVATRVTSAIQAEGEGKQFQDFAWKFLNIVSTCLSEMNEEISYKSLAFFVTRPKEMLLAYCDHVLPQKDPGYRVGVRKILDESNNKLDKKGNQVSPISRSEAVHKYISGYIESVISDGNYAQLQDSIIADLHYAANIGEEYYGKITASLGPVFDKINKTAAGNIFSWSHNIGLPEINLEDVIKRKQIIYFGLDAMSNKAMSDAVGQAIIADLISLCGRMYKEVPDKKRSLCLYADEFSEIVRDEFIILLNKAGGAGIQVTALSQTINDIMAAFGSNKDKPKMLIGNFGTIAMLRIANLDTARVFTECLESARVRTTTPSTMSNDKADGNNGELFTTYNTDVITEEAIEMVNDNDLFSLPKGQAFVLTNGGELYKIRMPLPKNDGNCPSTFESLMSEVNLCAV